MYMLSNLLKGGGPSTVGGTGGGYFAGIGPTSTPATLASPYSLTGQSPF